MGSGYGSVMNLTRSGSEMIKEEEKVVITTAFSTY